MMQSCAIWDSTELAPPSAGDYSDFDSHRAGGPYRVTGNALIHLARLKDEDRVKLTTWLVDQRRLGERRPTITDAVLDGLTILHPLRVRQRLDRALQLLDELGAGAVAREFRLGGTQDETTERLRNLMAAWTGSVDREQVHWIVKQLLDEHLIDGTGSNFSIGLKGWSHLEVLRSAPGTSKQAFVAMWFDASLEDAYRHGFEAAIVACGYVPLRIDRKEHVNKIDDEIIAEIRRSRFLVADFTSLPDRPRGGVYFEAGFAFGLNIPVIWTCRAEAINHVHFDTRQFNHILWQSPEELGEKLKNRIAAVIGYGPNAK
jgi:hypothetical protein